MMMGMVIGLMILGDIKKFEMLIGRGIVMDEGGFII